MSIENISAFLDMLEKSDVLVKNCSEDNYYRYENKITGREIVIQYLESPMEEYLSIYDEENFKFGLSINLIDINETISGVLLNLVINGIDENKPIGEVQKYYESVFKKNTFSLSFKVHSYYIDSFATGIDGTTNINVEYPKIFRSSAGISFEYDFDNLTLKELQDFSLDTLISCLNKTNKNCKLDGKVLDGLSFFKETDISDKVNFTKLMTLTGYKRIIWKGNIIYAFTSDSVKEAR